jgi:folate-binding protein YgfZ
LYKLIIVDGADALVFLQGQLTQDLECLAPGGALPAAWCNAQGRVLMTLRVVRSGDLFALAVAGDIVESAISRLKMYRLRAKVDFSVAGPEWQTFASTMQEDQAAAQPGETWSRTLPGEPMVTEFIVRQDGVKPDIADNLPVLDDDAWMAARISAGHVDISTANSGLYTPHMLNLDRCGAISFEKGCYTGQEIVARTEHRGRSKRRTLLFRCDAPELAIGDTLKDGDNDVGTVVNAIGKLCLAVAPQDVADKTLGIRGHPAILQSLPYDFG